MLLRTGNTVGADRGRSAPRDMIQAVDLRPELLPPPVSRQRLDELCSEIERIADLLASRREAANEAIAAFNAMTGHDYEALDFAEYDGSRNLEEFAREAARPARSVVSDLTREELVEIVRRLLTASPESDHYLRLLEMNVSHPRVSDLIFHPSDDLKDASAAEILDEALKYRPIVL
ncbi:bacteriocin immunity protein [Streptomyces sp. NPDC058385]|uniref:bacteriocin immunity protein n=1 Tax=Streptomyces sp. NPDC058385 TaxID=3346473 RepID=UPI00364D3D06